METCSKELALAIKLTKILSVKLTQGKEEASASPTQALFCELKCSLPSEIPPPLFTRALYFFHRVTLKNYTQLLPQQQEYALWFAAALLRAFPSHCTLKQRVFTLAVKVLGNLSLYLQHKELITSEEKDAFANCEALLATLFNFYTEGAPLALYECPEHCEKDFSAYFVPASVPEDFVATSSEQFPAPAALFAEEATQRTIYMYVAQTLEELEKPSELGEWLLTFLARCKVSPAQPGFSSLFSVFTKWATREEPSALSLGVLLGEISVAGVGVHEEIVDYLCRWLVLNEAENSVSEALLLRLCKLIIQGSTPAVEGPSTPALDLNGFGKAAHREEAVTAHETCTYSKTGTQFQLQHWYYCYTCKLVDNKGMCSVCAVRCHAGHDVVYSRKCNFFCDCGNEQGPVNCKCMPKGKKPKRLQMIENEGNLTLFRFPNLDIDDLMRDTPRFKELYMQSPPRYSPSPPITQLEDLEQGYSISSPPLEFPREDLPSYSEDEDEDEEEHKIFDVEEDDPNSDMDLEDNEEEKSDEEAKSIFSSDSSDKEKKDKTQAPARKHTRPFREHEALALYQLVNNTLTRLQLPTGKPALAVEMHSNTARPLCTFKSFGSQKVSQNEQRNCREVALKHPNSRNTLANAPDLMLTFVAENNRLICIEGFLFNYNGPDPDRAHLSVFSKTTFSFCIMSVKVNAANQRVVALSGLCHCACLLFSVKENRGFVEKKVTLSLGNNEKNPVVRIEWVPGETSQFALATTTEVKVFAFSEDLLIPLFSCNSLENDISDFVVVRDTLLIGSRQGYLYRQHIETIGGIYYFGDSVALPVSGSVVSLNYIPEQKLMFINLSKGRLLIARLDAQCKELFSCAQVDLDENSLRLSGGLSSVTRAPSHEFTYIGLSRGSSTAIVMLKQTEDKILVGSVKDLPKNIEGLCLNSKNGKHVALTQYDDGTLNTYSVVFQSQSETARTTVDYDSLNRWFSLEKLPSTVELPANAFEQCTGLTGGRNFAGFNRSEIVVSGDLVTHFMNSKQVLEKLSFERNSAHNGVSSAYLPDRKKIEVTASLEGSSANSLVFSGFKVNVDPGKEGVLEVLNRKIALQPNRRWYGVALCEAEIVKVFLMKELKFVIRSESEDKQPIILFHLELFAVNKHDLNLQDKLFEMYKASQGTYTGKDEVALYKACSWGHRFDMLDSLSSPEKSLIIYLNALASTLPSRDSEKLVSLISLLSPTAFVPDRHVFYGGLRHALKKVIYSMEWNDSYLPIKTVLSGFSVQYSAPTESYIIHFVKTLSALLRNNLLLFGEVLNAYPDILVYVHESLSPQSLLQCLEEYLKVLLGSMNYKATVCLSGDETFEQLYCFDPEIVKQEMELLISLLSGSVASFKVELIRVLYQLVKRRSKLWLRQVTNCLYSYSNMKKYELPQDVSINKTVEALLRPATSVSVCMNFPDLGYMLLYYLCKDWPEYVHEADGRLVLIYQLINYIEKAWAKYNLKDTRYLELLSSTLYDNLPIDYSINNQSKTLLFHLLVHITSCFRPKNEKSTKAVKLNRSIVHELITISHKKNKNLIYEQLRAAYMRFKQGSGTIKARYIQEFFSEVSIEKTPIELLRPDNSLLTSSLEALYPQELYEMHTDQVLFLQFIDLSINFLSGISAEDIDRKTDITSYLNISSTEEENAEMNMDEQGWTDMLVEMLLEPTLQFAKGHLETLLSILAPDYISLYSYKAASKRFYILQSVFLRSNSFKSLDYPSSLEVFKLLIELKKTLKTLSPSLEYLVHAILLETHGIQCLAEITLHLGGDVANQALKVLNTLFSVLKTERLSQWLCDELVGKYFPCFMGVLSQYSTFKFPKNIGKLISQLSSLATGASLNQLVSLILEYLPALPNLGLNTCSILDEIDELLSKKQDTLLIKKTSARILQSLSFALATLNSNINSETYSTLQTILHRKDYNLYILEPEPCLKCFSRNTNSYTMYDLNDCKAETRFSESAYFLRLKEPCKITKISVELSDIKGYKAIKNCTVYFSNKNSLPLSELKNEPACWTKVKSQSVKIGLMSTIEVELQLPIIVTNLCVEFGTVNILRSSLDEPGLCRGGYISGRSRYSIIASHRQESRSSVIGLSLGNDREVFYCLKCSKPLEGNCGNCACGENPYQCLNCRNINYNHLDAFFCTECGESRFGKVNVSLKGHPDAQYENLTSSSDVEEANLRIESEMEPIQGYFESLPKWQDHTAYLVSKFHSLSSKRQMSDSYKSAEFSPVLIAINSCFKEYRGGYVDMMIRVKTVVSLRQAILNSRDTDVSIVDSAVQSKCYGCNYYFIKNVLRFLATQKDSQLILTLIEDYEIIAVLVENCLRHHNPSIRNRAKKTLVTLVLKSQKGCERAYELIERQVQSVLECKPYLIDSIRIDIQLFLDLTNTSISTCFLNSEATMMGTWETTLTYFWRVFELVYKQNWYDSYIAEVLVGFLDAIYDMITKIKVFVPKQVPESVTELLKENPALLPNAQSKTNNNDLFLTVLAGNSYQTLFSDWLAGGTSFVAWLNAPAATNRAREPLPDNWLLNCLFHPISSKLQDKSQLIFQCLAASGLWPEVTAMLLSKLPAALVSSKQGYDVYFTALSRVLSGPQSMTPAILEFLFTSIGQSLEELLCLESVSQKKGITRVDISRGHGLVCLLHIIWSVSSEEWGTSQLRSSKPLINSVITSFLKIRKIELIKNKVILESKDYLEKLLDSLHLDCSLAQKATFLEQCIESFLSLQDIKEQRVLLEQMLKIIDPPRAEPIYHITLERLHTQEDYIRRNISKNNYTSKDIGPLMQHVRQKIAKEIDIAEPDVLELLVNEQIIAPQLKVTEVYEHIAWPCFQAENAAFLGKAPSDFPSAELPPMVVIFRLAGIDGEATEDIVDAIPTMDLDETSAEEKFAVTAVVSEGGMLEHSLSLLMAQSPLSLELLSVLTFACQIHSNREKLCATGGVQVIFGILDVSQKVKFKKVVALIELLVSDELTQPYVAGYPSAVSAILNLLHNETDREFTSEIIRIIPHVSNGNAPACQQIVSFFNSEIDLAALKRLVTNKIEEEIMNALSDALVAGQHIDPRFKFMFEGLVVMLDSLLVHHQTLKQSFHHAGFTRNLIEIFGEVQLESANPGYVVALINSLKGLLAGFQPAQALFPLVALEKMFHLQKSSHDIGTAAECFIEALLLSPALSYAPCIEKLTLLIAQERASKRLKAEHKREELLKQFILPELDMPEEESGLACVICQEGYNFKPNDILGFYIYSSPYTVDNSVESPEETSSGTVTIMSTVTHFNCIHYSCHQQATKAARTLRRPKSEWEGATIRNQHTKCNNWFPIKGPAISKDDYDNSVDRMFSVYNLYENRIRNCLHDLGLLLYRFCEEESFSKESRGGGPEHNLHAIPYLLQLLGFLAEVTPNEAAAYVASLERFQGSLRVLSPNGVLFFLCLCVNYMNREQWEAVKPELVLLSKFVARKAPKKRDRITGVLGPADVGGELLGVASGIRSVFIGIKLCDMVFNVLFAHCGEPWKASTFAYLDSADPSIRERTLQMYHLYKRYLSCSTLEQLAGEMEFRGYIIEENLIDWISN